LNYDRLVHHSMGKGKAKGKVQVRGVKKSMSLFHSVLTMGIVLVAALVLIELAYWLIERAKAPRRFRSVRIGGRFDLSNERNPVVCRKTSRFHYTPLSGPERGIRVRASSNLLVFNVEDPP
jgi:hypothetical protein